MSDLNERDLKQRTFGTVSVSVLAHAGLLALLILTSHPFTTEAKAAEVMEESPGVLVAANDVATSPTPPSPSPSLSSKTKPKPKVASKLKKLKPAARPAVKPVAKPEKQIEETDPEPSKAATQADVESLTPTIESPKDEQAELAAAAAREPEDKRDADDAPSESSTEAGPETASPTPKLTPKPTPKATGDTTKRPAKTETLTEGTPEPIVSSFEKPEATPSEKSDAVVAKVTRSTDGSEDVESTAPPAPTPSAVPADAQIRDAERLTLLSTKPFTYPQADRLANRGGTVYVIGKIRADGSVEDVIIEKSSGSKSMDQEAMRTFKQWKFSPGQEGYVRKPVQFILKGSERDAKSRSGR